MYVALAVLAGALAGWGYVLGHPPLRHFLATFEYAHRTNIIDVQPMPSGPPVWRLVFPFGHHNRMAYFSMLAALLFGYAAFAAPRPAGRAAAIAISLLSVINVMMTLNRGVLVGLAPALFMAVWAYQGRRSLWLLMALPVTFLLLPAMQRERLLTLFKSDTYTRTDSTIVRRFHHFKAAEAIIAKNPWMGVGYGWKHFELTYSEQTNEPDIDPDEATHAHNIWLEAAAESGFPGAVIFFAWNVWRWGMLLTVWRGRGLLSPEARRRAVFWAVAELAIQIYCLGNFPLRRSLGIITWGIWAVMCVDLLAMLPVIAQQIQNRTDKHAGG